MTAAQPFQVIIDDNAPEDADAFERAAELADYPALHPDHFRFLLPVMLPDHHRPVPCVATMAVDERGRVALDDAWIFLPGRRAWKTRRGRDFGFVKDAVFGPHIEDVVGRAIEHRAAFRPRAVAA